MTSVKTPLVAAALIFMFILSPSLAQTAVPIIDFEQAQPKNPLSIQGIATPMEFNDHVGSPSANTVTLPTLDAMSPADAGDIGKDLAFHSVSQSTRTLGINLLGKAAAQGNTDAALSLGFAADASADPTKAFDWFARSAAGGNTVGSILKGRAELYGIGPAIDRDDGVATLLKEYNTGGTTAAADLAKAASYQWSTVKIQDPSSYWTAAISSKDPAHLADYAQFLDAGGKAPEGQPDLPGLKGLFVSSDKYWGPVFAADIARDTGTGYTDLIKPLEAAQELGNVDATARLGEAYVTGDFGVEKVGDGIDLLVKATQAGAPTAYSALGSYYLQHPDTTIGRGEDYAIQQLRTGLALGDADAALGLAQDALQHKQFGVAFDLLSTGSSKGSVETSREAHITQTSICPAHPEAHCETISVGFATSRKPIPGPEFADLPAPDFTPTYGFAQISVPLDDVPQPQSQSALDLAWNAIVAAAGSAFGLQQTPANAFKDSDIRISPSTDWNGLVAGLVAGMNSEPESDGKHQVLLFVHGVGTTFDDALGDIARLKLAGNLPGQPMIYSWPSAKAPFRSTADSPISLGYDNDVNTALANCDAFQAFLVHLVKSVGAKNITIIAHSRGSALVESGLTTCDGAPADTPRVDKGIATVVYAAPDVDSVIFKRIAPQILQEAGNVTLYASSDDLALYASGNLLGNGDPRAGVGGPEHTLIPGLDTIDISTVAASAHDATGHGYVFSSRPVLDDLRELIAHGTPAASRCLVSEPDAQQHLPYWEFKQTCAN